MSDMVDEVKHHHDHGAISTAVIFIGFGIVVAVTVTSAAMLYWLYPPTNGSQALDIIRTAGSFGVGTGGAAALLLTARRQQSTELHNMEIQRLTREANENARHDAIERRITELQGQAGEQLGNTNAAVRLNGLYQLERLANEYPTHRQTIVNVLCAYLRMPYTPPGEITEIVSHEDMTTPSPETAAGEAERIGRHGSSEAGIHQELQVRMAVQRILVEHLRWAPEFTPDQNWGYDLHIDLSNATLVNFDFEECRFLVGFFRGAQFLREHRVPNDEMRNYRISQSAIP